VIVIEVLRLEQACIRQGKRGTLTSHKDGGCALSLVMRDRMKRTQQPPVVYDDYAYLQNARGAFR
jgi:hypothetical protein